MKDSLKGFPDEPRGSAWPPSARAVRCPAKSGNERDLRPQLLATHADRAHCGDCLRKEEEGAGYGRSVCSESSRLHARNNGRANGPQHREVKLILQTRSWYRLRLATQPHDAGIPSNRLSSYAGEYVPAPCTHRPSNQPSRVMVKPCFFGMAES